MKWLAARAYEQLQQIFTDEDLLEETGIKNVVVGGDAFPEASGIDGTDLVALMPAVVIDGAPGDAVTYSNIAHHHQAFHARVSVYLPFDPASDNPEKASQDAVSRLLEELVKHQAPVTLTDGHLYSIEPGAVLGYDRSDSNFFGDLGLPVAVGRFDVVIKAEAF